MKAEELQVGKAVRVVANNAGHGFKLGVEGVITELQTHSTRSPMRALRLTATRLIGGADSDLEPAGQESLNAKAKGHCGDPQ
jgi:hypothetical protein